MTERTPHSVYFDKILPQIVNVLFHVVDATARVYDERTFINNDHGKPRNVAWQKENDVVLI